MKQKIAEWLNVIFGFRKFLALMLLLIVGIVFRVMGYLSGTEFVDLAKNTTVAFFAANGVEHIVATVKDVVSSKVTPKPLADTDESNDEEEVEVKGVT